jgi:ABC-type Fe3+ transport system substrate-binding protein
MPDDTPGLTPFGKFVVALLIGSSGFGAWWYFIRNAPPANPANISSTTPAPTPNPGNQPTTVPASVSIGVVYGSEKEAWMRWAQEAFKATPAGRDVDLVLTKKGSIDAARQVVNEATSANIAVWLPSTSLGLDAFLADWKVAHSDDPIARRETLAITPMVLIWWQERYQAFMAKYRGVGIKELSLGLAEPGGWQTIANKPEWGLLKVGHAHPLKSGSGVTSLALLAQLHRGGTKALTMADVLDRPRIEWLTGFEQAVSGLSDSTGTQMKDMVLRGPSTYDCVLAYESVAIDYLVAANGRWGDLHVVYPEVTMWADNPALVFKGAWLDSKETAAANAFIDFLLSEAAQKRAVTHGFRPGDPRIPVLFPESPFVLAQSRGVSNQLGQAAEMPGSDVIATLVQQWTRRVAR